jgi:hypothetical protein
MGELKKSQFISVFSFLQSNKFCIALFTSQLFWVKYLKAVSSAFNNPNVYGLLGPCCNIF